MITTGQKQLTGAGKTMVLMYHRIDMYETNPWGVCVSPENFEKQIKFLKENYNVIAINDLLNSVKNNNNLPNAICITFDDGYADNYINASVILKKYKCAATFFIATAFINNNKPFWWDELEILLLHSKTLPHTLRLQLNGVSNEYLFNDKPLTDEQWQQHIDWKWHQSPPTDRCEAFINIWEKLRILPHEEIENHIDKIRKWACKKNDFYNYPLPMNDEQLKKLFSNELFTPGLHTHTHVDLQGKEKKFQLKEIVTCKQILKNKYNFNSNILAYPYGRFDNITIDAVKQLQLDACFTTEAKNISLTDLTMLGRYQVFDWDLNTFKSMLSNWLKH